MIAAEYFVWAMVFLIGYVFAGYPAALWFLAQRRARPVRQADVSPPVTLLISAFNEAAAIGGKLENALALDYPRDRLQIIVISDASTDDTDKIVSDYASRGVTLLRMRERGGKTVGLNAAVQQATGEILVFSDANILYDADALLQLMRNFADPEVGCVTGDSRYDDAVTTAAHEQESAYWDYERRIRSWESDIGSTVGGDGAIFAIRRELYRPLAPDAINDLVIPLQVVRSGFRAVFEPAAVGVEPSAGSFRREFRRKRRIVNRSWRGVMGIPEVLSPFHTGLFAWQVWSHKVLRWLVLPMVVVAAIACIFALSRGWPYQLGAIGFGASLALAAVGAFLPSRAQGIAKLAHTLFYFYLVNVAATLGIASAIMGRVDTMWMPERETKAQ